MSKDWDSVKKWMHGKTVVRGDMTIQRVAEVMDSKNIGSVIVSIDDVEKGLLTERDILRKVIAKGLSPNSVASAQVMTTPLVTVNQNATIWDAADIMKQHNIRRLPVTNERGEIIGIITTRTISNALPQAGALKLGLHRMKHQE